MYKLTNKRYLCGGWQPDPVTGNMHNTANKGVLAWA